MTRALVSVVIPVYNRRSLILQALESVGHQSYRPLEVIVVDDGSTDGTVETVKAWAREHACTEQFQVRLVQQEHKGGNPARNRGIRESHGEFIAFLDSDDVWLRDKLSKQIVRFQDPEVGAVYCGIQTVDLTTGKVLPTFRRRYPTGWILPQLLVRDVTAPTSTFVVRRRVFDVVGMFDESLAARQDWDMWIRVATAFKIEAVPEPLVQYRHHSGARTATDPSREIRAYAAIRDKYKDLLSRQPFSVRRAATASYYKRLGRVYFHYLGSRRKALVCYLWSLMNSPADFDTWAALFGIFLPRRIREQTHLVWNRIFGGTRFEVRSH